MAAAAGPASQGSVRGPKPVPHAVLPPTSCSPHLHPNQPRPPQEDLDAQLAAVFGSSDLTSSKALSLTEFLACLHAHQLQQIRSRPTMSKTAKKGSGGGGSGGGEGTAAAAAAAVAAK